MKRAGGLTLRSLVVLAIALATLATVHARQATAPRTMHVEGRVVDALSGQPLRGVVVVANVVQGSTSIAPAAAFLTAADGRFVFRDVPVGSVGLVAMKLGFLNGEIKPFTVPAGRKDDVRVALMPEGLISGRLVDQFGEPFAKASVKAVLQANAPVGEPGNLLRGVTVVSDDTGRFVIGGLEAGLYLLMVEGASGRTPRTHDQVFFPASLTADTATAIEVTAGAEHAGADMMVTVKPGSVDAGFGFPRPVPTEPATGSVSGIVRDASGRGLAHAAIVMERPVLGAVLRTILSDETGRFEFDRVPAGRFQLFAARDGYYVPRTTALATPPPAEIDVGPGQHLTGVVLTLTRAPALSGRLLDQFGDPIAGSVSLRLAKTPTAPRYLASINARGQFRIANIVPGDYVLFVGPNPSGRDLLAGSDARSGFRSANIVPGEYVLGVDPNPVGPDLRISEGPDNERTVALVPMYYPGVPEASMATPITIGPGVDVTGIDVIVRPEPVTTIEVSVDAPALELQSLGITRYSLDNPATPFVRGKTLPGGRQGYVSSTKAGRYLIVVAARESQGPAGPTRPDLGYGSNFWGSAEVSSDGVTPSSVTITLEPSARVSGTVVFEGRLAPQLVNPGLVSVDPLRGRDVFMNAALDKMSSGRASFAISQIQPGRYLFRLAGSRGPEAKPTWVVKSIVADGREALDRPIDLAPGADLSNVVITLSDQISEVSGTVTHDRTAHPHVIVMTFSPDPQQWIRGSMRSHSTSVGADGRYSLRGLVAGDYRVAAYDPADAPAGDDLSLLLKKLLPASVAMTIRLGETRTQDLTVK